MQQCFVRAPKMFRVNTSTCIISILEGGKRNGARQLFIFWTPFGFNACAGLNIFQKDKVARAEGREIFDSPVWVQVSKSMIGDDGGKNWSVIHVLVGKTEEGKLPPINFTQKEWESPNVPLFQALFDISTQIFPSTTFTFSTIATLNADDKSETRDRTGTWNLVIANWRGFSFRSHLPFKSVFFVNFLTFSFSFQETKRGH